MAKTEPSLSTEWVDLDLEHEIQGIPDQKSDQGWGEAG